MPLEQSPNRRRWHKTADYSCKAEEVCSISDTVHQRESRIMGSVQAYNRKRDDGWE